MSNQNYLISFKKRNSTTIDVESIYLPSHFTSKDFKSLLNNIFLNEKGYNFFIKNIPFTENLKYMSDILNLSTEEKIIVEYDEYDSIKPFETEVGKLYRLKSYGYITESHLIIFNNKQLKYKLKDFVRDFCINPYILGVYENEDNKIYNLETEKVIYESNESIMFLESYENKIIVCFISKMLIFNCKFDKVLFEYEFYKEISQIKINYDLNGSNHVVVTTLGGDILILDSHFQIKTFKIEYPITALAVSSQLFFGTSKGKIIVNQNVQEILTIKFIDFLDVKNELLAIGSQNEVSIYSLKDKNERFRYKFNEYIVGLSFYNEYLIVGSGSSIFYFKL